MRTIETKVFNFDELTEQAKETAIEEVRAIINNNFEPEIDMLECMLLERIKEVGFDNPRLQFSLSHCQGDGLSFSADTYNKLYELYVKVLGENKKTTARILSENTDVTIKGNTGRYCFSSDSDVELLIEPITSSYVYELDNCNEIVEQVESELRDIYLDLCNEMESTGYKFIEEATEDETIIEEIEANDREFTEQGELI